jgi:hypothetical protein
MLYTKHLLFVGLLALLLSLSILVWPSAAHAASIAHPHLTSAVPASGTQCKWGTVVDDGAALYAGDEWNSEEECNGNDYFWTLIYQTDGNLVLYQYDSGVTVATWASHTQGTCTGTAILQTDGNFVVYDCNGVARWASHTSGNGGDTLDLQSDGNLVIYSSGGSALWATHTNI